MGQVKPKGPDEMINCQKKTPFFILSSCHVTETEIKTQIHVSSSVTYLTLQINRHA